MNDIPNLIDSNSQKLDDENLTGAAFVGAKHCAASELHALDLANFASDCRALALNKYDEPVSQYIKARLRAGYFSPEDQYEALVNRIVSESFDWLDVGCGHSPFPNNPKLAAELSNRCQRLVGIDPDPNISLNRFLHEQYQLLLEDYFPTNLFNLVTARMVVEHVEQPAKFSAALSRVTRPGSLVVIFTVNWWSLTTLAARFSPMWFHHYLKSVLWNSKPQDSFKTEYKMNQRKTLQSIMTKAGFTERLFRVLPDASLFWRVPYLRRIELLVYRLMHRLRMPYIDSCILAVYQRV